MRPVPSVHSAVLGQVQLAADCGPCRQAASGTGAVQTLRDQSGRGAAAAPGSRPRLLQLPAVTSKRAVQIRAVLALGKIGASSAPALGIPRTAGGKDGEWKGGNIRTRAVDLGCA